MVIFLFKSFTIKCKMSFNFNPDKTFIIFNKFLLISCKLTIITIILTFTIDYNVTI